MLCLPICDFPVSRSITKNNKSPRRSPAVVTALLCWRVSPNPNELGPGRTPVLLLARVSRFDAPLEGSNEGPGNILADNADHGKVCFPGDGFSTSRQRTTSTPFDELKMAIAEIENAVTALQDRLHEKQVQASSTEEQITPLLDDDNGKLSKKPDAVTQATTRSARQHQKSTVAEDKLDDLTVKVLKNFLLDPDKLTLNSGGVGKPPTTPAHAPMPVPTSVPPAGTNPHKIDAPHEKVESSLTDLQMADPRLLSLASDPQGTDLKPDADATIQTNAFCLVLWDSPQDAARARLGWISCPAPGLVTPDPAWRQIRAMCHGLGFSGIHPQGGLGPW